MARRGWSNTNFLRLTTGIVTATPCTIAVWMKTSVTGSIQTVAGLYNSATAGTNNNFSIGCNVANTLFANTGAPAASNFASTSTTFTANTWFHCCGVFASATSRAVYLNGGGKGTNATSRVPSGINQFSVGTGDNAGQANPVAPSGTGDVAEVAVWSVALTDADVLALATGIPAYLIRPDALEAYYPLHGTTSPEINLKSNAAKLTIIGALTASAHVRTFRSPGKVNFEHSSIHAYLQTITAACAGAVSVAKGAGKGVSAACAGVVSYLKNTGKSLAVSCAGTVTRLLAVARTVGAACAGTVSIGSPRNVVQTVVAACVATLTLARAAGKGIVAACTGTVSAGRAVGKGMAVACTGAVAVAKAVAKFLALAATCTVSIQADFNLPPTANADDLGWIRIVLRRRR